MSSHLETPESTGAGRTEAAPAVPPARESADEILEVSNEEAPDEQQPGSRTRRAELDQLTYYALVPQKYVRQDEWEPPLEAAAWGVAAADYGAEAVTLMGLSAAPLHGAIPRALAVAVLAVPRQRPPLTFTYRPAEVVFVTRAVSRLDLERHALELELGDAYVTTVEQTVLDLAARPQLGGVPREAQAAARALLLRADRELLWELARGQRRLATLRRLKSST